MNSQDILLPLFNGFSQGMLLFLVASGLSLVFGVLGVLNFAHAGFFMLGAYVAFDFAGGKELQPVVFMLVVIGAGFVVAFVGVLVEVLLFRRMYQRDHLDFVLLSFGLLLVIEGAVRERWGPNAHSLPQPAHLGGSFILFDVRMPTYSLFVIVVALIVVSGLAYLLVRTPIGRIINAVAEDRWMADALGINVSLVFTGVLALGVFLAGLGGGMVAPYQAIQPTLAALFVVESFAVVTVGGLDSVPGALVAAVLLGWLNSFLVIHYPTVAEFSLYLGMAAVLLIRPQGLLGRKLVTR